MTLGHSFVSRFKQKIWGEAKRTSRSIQQVTAMDEEEIVPYYFGISSLKICDIPELHHHTGKHSPQIVVLDIGTNDIGDHLVTPEMYASNLVKQAEKILEMQSVQFVVLCYGIMRNKVIKSIKPLEVLNDDIKIFNHHLLKHSRNNMKMMRWIHRGFDSLDETLSLDGIHPNAVPVTGPRSTRCRYMPVINLQEKRCSTGKTRQQHK